MLQKSCEPDPSLPICALRYLLDKVQYISLVFSGCSQVYQTRIWKYFEYCTSVWRPFEYVIRIWMLLGYYLNARPEFSRFGTPLNNKPGTYEPFEYWISPVLRSLLTSYLDVS